MDFFQKSIFVKLRSRTDAKHFIRCRATFLRCVLCSHSKFKFDKIIIFFWLISDFTNQYCVARCTFCCYYDVPFSRFIYFASFECKSAWYIYTMLSNSIYQHIRPNSRCKYVGFVFLRCSVGIGCFVFHVSYASDMVKLIRNCAVVFHFPNSRSSHPNPNHLFRFIYPKDHLLRYFCLFHCIPS